MLEALGPQVWQIPNSSPSYPAILSIPLITAVHFHGSWYVEDFEPHE